MTNPIAPGTLLHNRYYLLRALRPGEFGWLYSAVDRKRDNHLCWLEQLTVPSSVVPDLEVLRQALQRQIRRLSSLQHPQVVIPKVAIVDRAQLFLVQPYLEGVSYREWLGQHRSGRLPEAEVVQILGQLLELLAEMHAQGWGHHNLTLDSIIYQQTESQLALVHPGALRDLLIDWGFQPIPPRPPVPRPTQIPDRDFFDLATIALQLLTGQVDLAKTPPTLASLLTDKASTQLGISPRLMRVLRRLRSPQPRVRYTSATAVLEALQIADRCPVAVAVPTGVSLPKVPYLDAPRSPDHPPFTPNNPPIEEPIPFWQDRSLVLLTVIFILFSGVALWRIWRFAQPIFAPALQSVFSSSVQPALNTTPSPAITPSEKSPAAVTAEIDPLPASVRSQVQNLGISIDLFVACVDELADGSPASPDRRDKPWQQLAETLAQKLTTLSPEARNGMGTYRRSSLDRWLSEAQALSISSQTINLLADQQFFSWFPNSANRALNPRQLGQVWYAIAHNQILKLPEWLISIPTNSPPFEQQAKLEAGQSRIYQITQPAGHLLQVQLQAKPNSTRLSIVQGQTLLARNSPETRWSALTAQSGRYEIIISSTQGTSYTIVIQ